MDDKEFESQAELFKKKHTEIAKQSEEDSSEFLYPISDMFQVIELIYDNDGQAIDYYCRDVNPAFERLVNKSREELINKRAKDIFGIVEAYWIQTFEKVAKTGKSTVFENYGAELKKFYSIYAWKVGEDKVAIIFNDVTESKKDALNAHTTEDGVYSKIAHKFKNPFNAILGFSNILATSAEDLEVEKTQKFSSIIQVKAKNTLTLLDNILDWEKCKARGI